MNFIWKTAIASEFLFFQTNPWQTLGLGHLIQVESWIIFVRKAEIFLFEKVRHYQKFFIVNESRRTAYKIRSCIVLKDASAKKLCCERTSQFYYFYLFVYIQCRRRRATDRLHLKFPYYSFKIFARFWLAKSTRLIHHNQLLMTKFGRNLTLTRKWRQKCSVFAG